MPTSLCRVCFRDRSGFEHAVEVTAESLNEAAALALHVFREARWSEDVPGPGATLEVTVQPPSQTHHVPVSRLEAWLQSAGKSPKEQAVKKKLRELLGT